MSAKTQHNNILLAVLGFVSVVIIVGLIGFFLLDRSPDVIQGEVEVSKAFVMEGDEAVKDGGRREG